ncbi:MAG: protocatechuate 3,4-dioxygenase subunit alpha [Caulobacter sp.]|nr:protocatechuate 3,4-dioxygenase subunit alpha [Caulobacter sp.]
MTEQVNPAPRQDNQDPGLFGQTPSQTVGPYFHYGLPWKGGADLVGDMDMGARADLFAPDHYMLGRPLVRTGVTGDLITIEGIVLDGAGQPVPDALIEIWQANAQGRYFDGVDNSGFIGFGRASTGDDGWYRFRTIRPGQIEAGQAPHIAIGVLGRGLIKRLSTRLYFADHAANAVDPVLALVPAERRDTLIARKVGAAWRFDIVLQGERETVFFDI